MTDTRISHTLHADTNRNTHTLPLFFSLLTHPNASPASLPPLVSVSLSQKKRFFLFKDSTFCRLRFSLFFLCVPLLYKTPAFCRLCTAWRYNIPSRGISNESPVLLLMLLTSLYCSSSQLSFPAACLSTASPTFSSSLFPPLFYFCLPVPLCL